MKYQRRLSGSSQGLAIKSSFKQSGRFILLVLGGLLGGAGQSPVLPTLAQQEQSTAVTLEHTLETLGGLKSVPLKARWTKRSLTFQVKNLLVYQLPKGFQFPENTNFRGLVGTISTTTAPRPDGKPASSETLFGLSYTQTGSCPKNGETVASYPALFETWPSQNLAELIIKQAHAGTKTIQVGFELPVGIPLHHKPSECLYTIFDGTDFANQPYTLSVDLHLLYDTLPSPLVSFRNTGVDAEFLVSPNTWGGAVLNAYSVSPVGPQGSIQPGELLDVWGNVAATTSIGFAQQQITSGKWSERVLLVVYRKAACEKAFPHHRPYRFLWNDYTGAGNAPNPSSALWPETIRVIDEELTGTGSMSVIKQVDAIATVPVHLNEGDCVAAAFLPNTDSPEGRGTINVEDQFRLLTTP